jgi:hypothetical protein
MNFKRSTYYSLFFLICFLTSLSVNAYRNSSGISAKHCDQHSLHFAFSSNDDSLPTNNDFLFEETEDETENDILAPEHSLPYFIFNLKCNSIQKTVFSVSKITINTAIPIYLSNRNFRI